MNWLYAILWFFGMADAVASASPPPKRKPTARDTLDECLRFCQIWRQSCQHDRDDARVLEATRRAIADCIKRHDELLAVAGSGDPAALLSQANELNAAYRQAMDLVETDRQSGLNAHGDLEMAGYRLRELEHYEGDNSRFTQLLQQAQALNDARDFPGASRLATQVTALCERERYVQAWRQSLTELASWRHLDGDVTDLAPYAVMPDVVATTRAEELTTATLQPALEPVQVVLALATHERVISNNACAGRWHHFVYPRLPDYKKVAEVAALRVKYSDERFGAMSPEKLSAWLSYARASQANGTFYGVPGCLATTQERADKQVWELQQYDLGFAATLMALAIADATFGADDKRAQRVVLTAAFTTRSTTYPLADQQRTRLKTAREAVFSKR